MSYWWNNRDYQNSQHYLKTSYIQSTSKNIQCCNTILVNNRTLMMFKSAVVFSNLLPRCLLGISQYANL